jgi:23S rRNA pseudouridine2605 synthase
MPRNSDNNDKNRRHAGKPSGGAPFRAKPAGTKPGGRPPFRPKKLRTSLPRPAADAAPLPERKSAERIAKVIARAGLCSRRDAEEWILAGRVAVNGAVIPSPALNVKPADTITVDGKPLPQRERTRLFLYYKPRGLVTTNSDPEGRPTIFGALPKNLPRLISVGRLDLNTEGLLLLTNDGGLARVLELPETGWLRRYRVRALGRVTQAALDDLRNGIEIDGVRYGAIEATLDREQGFNIWLTFAIREGKNREVRNVLEHLGLKVNRLIRLSFGPFQLGELKEAAVEEVKTRMLRDQLGERIVAQAGVDFDGPVADRSNPERGESPSPSAPLRGALPSPRKRGEGGERRSREPGEGHRDARSKGNVSRHPEVRVQRASKSGGPGRGHSPFEGRLRRPPQDDDKKRITRNDVIADRRGRKIPVTRTHTEKSESLAALKPRGKPPRRDRTRGPRPSRPR